MAKVTQHDEYEEQDILNRVFDDSANTLAVAFVSSPSLYAPITQVTNANIKAAAGNLLSVFISNQNAALRYLQFFNSASAPSGGATPLISIPIPAGNSTFPGNVILDNSFFTQAGLTFSTGISWGVSTTFATFTAATATDHIIVATYL